MTLQWSQALGWRMERQHLDAPTGASVSDVVRRLGAVPAVSGNVELAVALRRNGSELTDVAAELSAGRLIKTYAFRGATHLMTLEDARVFLPLRAAGRQWELPSWQRHYDLTPQEWPKLRAVVREALSAKPLSRRELAAAVVSLPEFRHLRAAFADRSDTFIKPFAWQGDLSLGPLIDGELTFRFLGEDMNKSDLELDEVGQSAVVAYFSAYGPATPDRLQYWLGEGLSAGKGRIAKWLQSLQESGELVEVRLDNESVLCSAEYVEAVSKSSASRAVCLLPGYDQWVLGAGTRDTHIVPPHRRAMVTRGANLIITGGRMTGTWKYGKDVLDVSWFAEDGAPPVEGIERQVRRIAGLVDRRLELEVSVID